MRFNSIDGPPREAVSQNLQRFAARGIVMNINGSFNRSACEQLYVRRGRHRAVGGALYWNLGSPTTGLQHGRQRSWSLVPREGKDPVIWGVPMPTSCRLDF